MKRLLLLVGLVSLALPLWGEMTGKVEYELPSEAKTWRVEELTMDKSTGRTTLYMPENQNPLAVEFFGAHMNNRMTNLKDKAALEGEIQKAFPQKKVEFNVLAEDENSELVEWVIKSPEGDQPIVHGWARIFSVPDQTVMLFYQTEKVDNMDQKKEIWIPVLEKAKLKTENTSVKGEDSPAAKEEQRESTSIKTDEFSAKEVQKESEAVKVDESPALKEAPAESEPVEEELEMSPL